jgi:hypothetical protein
MWCTQCHTAFSWKTGDIETKIHNPHYYEWLRKTRGSAPREPGDIVGGVCGLEWNELALVFAYLVEDKHVLFNDLCNYTLMCRNIGHLKEYTIHHMNEECQTDNEIFRRLFLQKKFDETEFRRHIFIDHKRSNRINEIRTVLELITTASIDIIRNLYHQIMPELNTEKGVEIIKNTNTEIDELVAYSNRLLTDIYHTYNSKSLKFITEMITYEKI